MWWYPEPLEPEEERARRRSGAERARQGLLGNLIGWLIAFGILVAVLVAVALLVRWLS